ncbi:MAG: hypothetical protein JWN75_562 [Candidatus Saccharibacteria bacterium]|nr:hypothetical protein [Candidatus Saccharibacteria bacterium]
MSNGIDDAILSEFPGTIDLYTKKPIEKGIAKIVDRYSRKSPLAIGSIAMRYGQAIGLVYAGIAEFQEANDAEPTQGINVSSWLSAHYRGRGFGHEMVQHETSKAVEQTLNRDNQNWHNKQIWTSIKIGNIASRHVYERAGFMIAGTTHDDQNRQLYLHSHTEL